MKILKKKCEHCGKEITSMYQKQLEYNYKAHTIACQNNTQGEPTAVKNPSEALSSNRGKKK